MEEGNLQPVDASQQSDQRQQGCVDYLLERELTGQRMLHLAMGFRFREG
jgi:hypothetical protein